MNAEPLEDLEHAASRSKPRRRVIASNRDHWDAGFAEADDAVKRFGQRSGRRACGVEQVSGMGHGVDVALDRDLDRAVPDRVDIAYTLVELAIRVQLPGKLTEAEVGI